MGRGVWEPPYTERTGFALANNCGTAGVKFIPENAGRTGVRLKMAQP